MTGTSYGIGKINFIQTKLTWVIEDFEKKASKEESLISPYFIIPRLGYKLKWNLRIFFDEKNEDNQECMGIYIDLSRQSLDKLNFQVDLEFSILKFDKTLNNFIAKEVIIDADLNGASCFITKDELFKNLEHKLDNGSLTIVCTITTEQYLKIKENKAKRFIEDSVEYQECNQKLLHIFEDKTFSDVTFLVEGKEIHAHKCIIANNSILFKTMFTNGMMETNKNQIEINDVDYETMHDLLKYIYSTIVPEYSSDLIEKYQHLMVAADKYDIIKLKMECESKLVSHIHIDNVFECLNFADMHNATFLKMNAINFIVSNSAKIIETPSYKKIATLNADNLCAVFRAVVDKKNSNC